MMIITELLPLGDLQGLLYNKKFNLSLFTRMRMALDAAQAVVVAPVQYSLLLWGTLYGFAVFGQLPDAWTLFGAAIIVVTGLYTLNRERIALRASKSRDSQTR